MSTRKEFLVDKSVFLYSPYAVFAFDDNDVVIPLSVIREMQNIATTGKGEPRANASEFGTILDELSKEGNLREGIPLKNSVRLVVVGDVNEPILDIAKANGNYTLVSRDPFLRVEASAAYIYCEEYKSDQAPTGAQSYDGRCCLFVSEEEMQAFAATKKLNLNPAKDYTAVKMDGETIISTAHKLTVNEYIVLKNASNPSKTMLGRYDGRAVVPLSFYQGKETGRVYGIEPMNVGQIFALDALLAPAKVAPLVILKGPAGTAKTFLSMAAALAQTIDCWGGENTYRKILITRPNTKMDEDIGFLKGDEKDKVLPALRGLIDNVDNLSLADKAPANDRQKDGVKTESVLDELLARGTIDAQAMAYMRGRSIQRQFIVCDEMQNATINQVLSLVTRTAEGSKIVLLGDPNQIDHPYLDQRTNGISYAATRMRGSKLCFQLTFDESECTRSPLASEAIARLTPKGAI